MVVFSVGWNGYLDGRKAMYLHKSQMVWFRHLYLLTSCFMLRNELSFMNPEAFRKLLNNEKMSLN
jgi:N-acetylglucosaminylphosphatidylinositol deacetylase